MKILRLQDVPMEDFAALDEYTQYAGDVRYNGENTPALERPEAIRLVERLRARARCLERMHGNPGATDGGRPSALTPRRRRKTSATGGLAFIRHINAK